jgi:hypothetical protein
MSDAAEGYPSGATHRMSFSHQGIFWFYMTIPATKSLAGRGFRPYFLLTFGDGTARLEGAWETPDSCLPGLTGRPPSLAPITDDERLSCKDVIT